MQRPQARALKGVSDAATLTLAADGNATGTGVAANPLVGEIVRWLDEAKAENIVTLDIAGKTSIGDAMIIASGRSDRHVGAIADQVERHLKTYGVSRVRVEGAETCDWVLIDAGAIIVHVFRPEVRTFYNLEKMWSSDRPAEPATH